MLQPPWLACAWAELGQREVSGAADNERITALFRDAGAPAYADEVPWCAAFVGACLQRAGVAGTRSLMARSYLQWGEQIADGRIGAIAVLSRGSDPSAGHVGFLLGESGTRIYLLGGNQGDAVSVTAFPKARLLGLRWPAHTEQAAAPAPVSQTPEATLFERALAHVLEMEGGFTDDPYDPGGPTNRGITLAVYAAWKGVAADAALTDALKRISDADVRAIYSARYWQPAACAELAPALAFFHFDAAVNHGVTGAIRLLQQAVGTGVDGEIGPLTRAAIARLPLADALHAYADARRRRYRALPHYWRFGRGWLRRVDVTRARALPIAVAAPAADPSPQREGASDMAQETTPATPAAPAETRPAGSAKWWGSSVTIWGAIITALSTVLPALGPALGIDITGDLVRELGDQLVVLVQAVGGLIGTVLTIYGRMRASQPLSKRDVTLQM
jgi:uncharacterized protein (TIGR02594 family)